MEHQRDGLVCYFPQQLLYLETENNLCEMMRNQLQMLLLLQTQTDGLTNTHSVHSSSAAFKMTFGQKKSTNPEVFFWRLDPHSLAAAQPLCLQCRWTSASLLAANSYISLSPH